MSYSKSMKLPFRTVLGMLFASSLAACGGGSESGQAGPLAATSQQVDASPRSNQLLARRVKVTQPPPTPTPPPPGSPWTPPPGTSFQIQFSGTVDTNLAVQMFDVDAYDTSATTIAAIKAKGAKVVCYFSAGSYENYRTDTASFPASVLGNTLSGWPDERWLDIRQVEVLRTIMGKRMDVAKQKGCDGVDPDNMDGYTNATGFPLVAQDQINYNKMIAEEAHKRSMSVSLKNDVEQVNALAPYFDFAINEQCFQYNECGAYSAFTGLNKAVFGIEYTLDPAIFCPKANAANFDFIKKNLSLDAFRISCREKY